MKNDLPLPLGLVILLLISSTSVVATNHFDDPIIIDVDLELSLIHI